MNQRIFGLAALGLLGLPAFAACASETTIDGQRPVHAAPAFELSAQPEAIIERYRFVERHPEVVDKVACYCACDTIGHHSLKDCFLAPGGGYDRHASVCGVCLAEADDIERMLAQGMTTDEIAAAIDANYG